MKLIIILLSLLSFSAFSQSCPPDVSSFCFNEMRHDEQMSFANSAKFCRDVSNTCYMDAREYGNSKVNSRNRCHNVSNNCYSEVTIFQLNAVAARACSNVNNKCYTNHRDRGLSIRSSILACEDVATDCRLCDLQID